MIDGIAINIISAPIIFIFGIIFTKKIFPSINERFNPLAKYIAPKNPGGGKNICVIHGYARTKSQQKDIAYIQEGDLGALLASSKLLSSSFDEKKITFKDGIEKNDCGEEYDTVICVSGPKWNKCTEHYIGAVGSPVSFLKNPKCVSAQTSKMNTPNIYQTETNDDGTINTCYGFVVYSELSNENYEKKNILICCGRSTHSTYASLSVLTQIKNRSGVYRTLKSRGIFQSKGAWGVLFKITKKETENTPYKIDIMQVFLRDEFLDPYIYEYH